MFRPLALFIGARYTRAKRRNQFISFISLLSLLGMMLGVAVLIVVISVMNGFEAEIRGRTLQAIPHLYVNGGEKGLSDYESLRTQLLARDEVVAVAPYVGGKGMLSVPGVVRGVSITGIDPVLERGVANIAEHMLRGEFESLKAGGFGVVLGSIVANHLGLGLGDRVAVTLPQISITPMGVFPRVKRFTVVGIFEVGAQEDSTSALIHIDDAAKLFASRDKVHGLRLKLNDLFEAPALGKQLAEQFRQGLLGNAKGVAGLEDLEIVDWSQTQGGLFSAIKMEKTMVGFLLMIVVAVAAFNIISIVVMMVADKRAAIAVLRTMGMRAGSVVAIFITQGSLIGLSGVLMGALLGVITALNVSKIVAFAESVLGQQLFDPSVYYIAHVPSVVRVEDVVLISGLALCLSVLATIYPAWKAASIEAAEVLRYE